jgi:hypothetical protein
MHIFVPEFLIVGIERIHVLCVSCPGMLVANDTIGNIHTPVREIPLAQIGKLCIAKQALVLGTIDRPEMIVHRSAIYA